MLEEKDVIHTNLSVREGLGEKQQQTGCVCIACRCMNAHLVLRMVCLRLCVWCGPPAAFSTSCTPSLPAAPRDWRAKKGSLPLQFSGARPFVRLQLIRTGSPYCLLCTRLTTGVLMVVAHAQRWSSVWAWQCRLTSLSRRYDSAACRMLEGVYVWSFACMFGLRSRFSHCIQ